MMTLTIVIILIVVLLNACAAQKKCRNCQTILRPGANFCPRCGTPVANLKCNPPPLPRHLQSSTWRNNRAA